MVGNIFRSNVKVAFRNLLKHKVYSIINIFGLILGFTCCILIFKYAFFERSYDKNVANYDKVYRLRLDLFRQNKLAWQSATVFPGIGPAMKREIPEIEDICRLYKVETTLFNSDNRNKHHDNKTYYADPSFFRIFSIQFSQFQSENILSSPDEIVLSQSMARLYFGTQPAVGRTLLFRTPQFQRILLVVGVFNDLPDNSHLKINQIISYSTFASINKENGDSKNSIETSWGWYDFYTYFKLKSNADIRSIQTKLASLCNEYYNNGDRQKKNNLRIELHTIPLRDIHLYSNSYQEAEVNGDGKMISFLLLISLLTISIAWINYINLTTARSMERAKEVGIRKVMGASRFELVKQFMEESILVNIIALLLATGLELLLTPWFRGLTGIAAQSSSVSFEYFAVFISIFLFGTFFSGLYPAFVLSKFKPATILKGKMTSNKSGIVFRRGLIVWQFFISIVLIATTFTIFKQVEYMRDKNLGVNISQIIVLDGSSTIQDSVYQLSYKSFKSDILNISGVKGMSASSDIIGREISLANLNNRIGSNNQVTLYNIDVDYDFIPMYGLKLANGRKFEKEYSENKSAILNEEAIKLLEFENSKKAINNKIVSDGDTLTITGIIHNYHHEGLQKAIPPIIFRIKPDVKKYYSVKLENAKDVITKVQAIWDKYYPNDPFNYYFLDDLFNQQYKADERFSKAFTMFTLLSVFISCIGLLGLSAFTTAQRAKEIGIRKILGASIFKLIMLLSKEVFVVFMISFILATPVILWIAHKWLDNFAFRVNIQPLTFLLSGIIMIIISFITIWSQALKTIMSRPVKILRSE
jgi:putative ABC transport system permease protein